MPEFSEFSSSLTDSFSAELTAAIGSAPLPALDEGSAVHGPLKTLLQGGIGDHLIDVSPTRQMELLSALWLGAGDIHLSHSISQDLPSAEGSFLHGIMHRREGDFGNAKYWFRRVGAHPVFQQIAELTDGHYSDPFDFVDHCQRAWAEGQADLCMESQWAEWQALAQVIIDG